MGYYMVFRGKGRGFSCRHQSIKVVLEKIDCQLWGKGVGKRKHKNITQSEGRPGKYYHDTT